MAPLQVSSISKGPPAWVAPAGQKRDILASLLEASIRQPSPPSIERKKADPAQVDPRPPSSTDFAAAAPRLGSRRLRTQARPQWLQPRTPTPGLQSSSVVSGGAGQELARAPLAQSIRQSVRLAVPAPQIPSGSRCLPLRTLRTSSDPLQPAAQAAALATDVVLWPREAGQRAWYQTTALGFPGIGHTISSSQSLGTAHACGLSRGRSLTRAQAVDKSSSGLHLDPTSRKASLFPGSTIYTDSATVSRASVWQVAGSEAHRLQQRVNVEQPANHHPHPA